MTEDQAEELLNRVSHMNTLLSQLLDGLQEINLKLSTSATSSVQLEENSRGLSRTVKAYTGSPVQPAFEDAVTQFTHLKELSL